MTQPTTFSKHNQKRKDDRKAALLFSFVTPFPFRRTCTRRSSCSRCGGGGVPSASPPPCAAVLPLHCAARFQSECSPWRVRFPSVVSPPTAPPPILACLGLSKSDRSPPVARPSEIRRQARVPPVESPCKVGAHSRTQNEQRTPDERRRAVCPWCARGQSVRCPHERRPSCVCGMPVVSPSVVRPYPVHALSVRSGAIRAPVPMS